MIMKHYLFLHILHIIFILGCSDVEFFATEEALLKAMIDNNIQINYGAQYTQDQAVHLSILGKKDQEMYVTNDPSCKSGGSWEKYSSEKAWTLGQLNQEAKVYVKFKGERDVESNCLSDDIIHDNIPPELSFKNPPRSLNNQKDLDIELEAKDNISGVKVTFCSLEEDQSFSECENKLYLKALSEGTHSVAYSAIDRAGNKSEPVSIQWRTDLTPPRVHFHKVPPKLSNLSDFRMQYYAEDESGIAGFNCSFNRASYKSCLAETQIEKLKDGQHLFTVMAVDKAGNYSQPIEYDWIIDKEIPTVRITKHPNAYTRETQSEFQFIGVDAGIELTRYECQINSQTWQPCKSPYTTPNLNKGVQTFRVRTFDLAGNVSSPSVYTWVIDLTSPHLQLIEMPPALTNKRNAAFDLLATDNESGVKKYLCWLDSQLVACKTDIILNNLSDDIHNFEALAEDNVGNLSERVKYTWTIDLAPPQVKLTRYPNAFIAESEATFEFEAVDNYSSLNTFYCNTLNNNYQVCKSPFTVKGLTERGQMFYVKAVDEAGNESLPISYTWTVDKTPPHIQFIQKPVDHMNFVSSQFKLKIEDKLSGFERAWCGLKGQLSDCSALESKAYELAPGEYEFEVIAMDKVGNKSSASHRWQVLDKYKSMELNFTIDEKGADVDILFVVDNSDSMAVEQRNMAQRIDNFISKIQDLNWQIAVTSTDPNKTGFARDCTIGFGCTEIPIPHGDGGLVQFINGSHVMSKGTPLATAQRLLGQAIQLGTGGSSSEEGIKASYRVLEKSLDSRNSVHRKFIRYDASLAIVLISDEDESSHGKKNKPENLINFVKDNWPKKSFRFHSMINLPEFKCKDNDLAFGYQYFKLSQATEGIVGSVCQDNYSEDLSTIGEDVKEQVSTVELQCEPQDRDGDGQPELVVTLQGGNRTPSFVIKGKKVVFARPLPPGQHTLRYHCLK